MSIADHKVTFPQIILLLAILILAFLLRLWGIGGLGLPRVGYVDDEPAFADAALELLRQDQLDFSKWRIGAAQIYFQAFLGKIIFAAYNVTPAEIPTYKEILSAKKISSHVIGVPYPLPEFYFWGRVSVAILGGFSVLILYLIGKEIKSNIVGLISAFFLAVTSLHVEYSHYLIRTVPGLFCLLLTLYLILLAYLKRKWQLYLFSSALAYLAVYTKQNNLIILAPLGLALIMSIWREFQDRPIQEIAKYTMIIGSVTTVFLILSWIFLEFNIFASVKDILYRILYNPYLYGGYHFGFSGQDTSQWLIEQLLLGPSATWKLITLFAIPGLILAIQLKEKGWLLLALLLPYLLMMSLLTVRFLHWLLPVIPILALLAALSLEWMYIQISQRKIIKQQYFLAIFYCMIILIPSASLRAAITLDYYAGQPDIRNITSQWLQANLPHGSKVVIDGWGPYLDSTHHTVVYVPYIGNQDLQEYLDDQVDYLVLNSINISRIISAQSDPRASEIVALQTNRLSQIMQKASLEQEFVGPALFNPPIIKVFVYKLE